MPRPAQRYLRCSAARKTWRRCLTAYHLDREGKRGMARRRRVIGTVLFAALVAVGGPIFADSRHPVAAPDGIHKIKHVIIIMQENRSFDSYFGTFPGADGIPMKNGAPAVCVPDPKSGQCVAPYVDHADVNGGGPHSAPNAVADINGGQMNGFIGQAQTGQKGCLDPTDPACTNSATPDVMGYHTQSDIPNYWTYA